MIEYKGYVGWVEFDDKTNQFLGKVSNVDTLITFQGQSMKHLKEAFKNAVDEYLEWCTKHKKEPEIPSPSHIDVL